MTLEQKILLSLLSSALTKTPVALPEDAENINWQLVIKEATLQAVALMAVDTAALNKFITKADYRKEFRKAYLVSLNNAQVENSQNKLVELLDKHNKPYVILKGTAAASYYPSPMLRHLGDVDFLIDPKDKDEISQLLLNDGYERYHENHACHVVFKKPKEHLEMHFEVVGIPTGIAGKKIRKFFKNAVLSSKTVTGKDIQFRAPSDVYHAVIILLHMQHHMLGEGLGLRHLTDWACFVQKTADAPFWHKELLPFLREVGLFTYAAVMTKTTAIYLGISCPVWADGVSNELAEQVIEDILAGGNFGKRDVIRARSGIMVSNHGKDGVEHSKIYYVFKTLKVAVDQRYPKAKKYKILYPFCFVWRGVRYLLLMLCGKRVSFAKMLPKADERQKLYKKLQIFKGE